jgi:hypothetical protein
MSRAAHSVEAKALIRIEVAVSPCTCLGCAAVSCHFLIFTPAQKRRSPFFYGQKMGERNSPPGPRAISSSPSGGCTQSVAAGGNRWSYDHTRQSLRSSPAPALGRGLGRGVCSRCVPGPPPRLALASACPGARPTPAPITCARQGGRAPALRLRQAAAPICGLSERPCRKSTAMS